MVEITDMDMKNFFVTRIMTEYRRVAKEFEDENPGLIFKHFLNDEDGYMWVVGCYEEQDIILYPKYIQSEIKSKVRDIENVHIERREGDTKKDVKATVDKIRKELKVELKKLRKWKKECRQGVYRSDKRDICAAYTVYLMMEPDIIRPILTDVLTALNDERDRIFGECEKIRNQPKVKIIDISAGDEDNEEEPKGAVRGTTSAKEEGSTSGCGIYG